MKKLLCVLTAATMFFTVSVYGQDNIKYIELRKAFEEQNKKVIWNIDTPDRVIVDMGNYPVNFNIGTNIITTDEGSFKTEGNSYIENGVAYISEDSVELCSKLLLYHNAIIDAMQADEAERLPLRSIDTSEEKVLVCTWHRYPESYKDGDTMNIKYGDVWVFCADEIKQWGKDNGMAEDMPLRMQQLIGLPPQKGNTYFTLLWVNPKDLYRPSPDMEINDNIADLTFPENTPDEYIEWFNSCIISSYYPHKYPWTRLGYTYDWADNGTEYGLSEFIIRNGSQVSVEKTYTNEEFFNYIAGN